MGYKNPQTQPKNSKCTFRKALLQAHVPNGVISDAFDIKLNSTLQAQLNKVKMQVCNLYRWSRIENHKLFSSFEMNQKN